MSNVNATEVQSYLDSIQSNINTAFSDMEERLILSLFGDRDFLIKNSEIISVDIYPDKKVYKMNDQPIFEIYFPVVEDMQIKVDFKVIANP